MFQFNLIHSRCVTSSQTTYVENLITSVWIS